MGPLSLPERMRSFPPVLPRVGSGVGPEGSSTGNCFPGDYAWRRTERAFGTKEL